jgi:hypothetical protein
LKKPDEIAQAERQHSEASFVEFKDTARSKQEKCGDHGWKDFLKNLPGSYFLSIISVSA